MNQPNQPIQPNIPQEPQQPQPNVRPEMPKKSGLPTWASVSIVVLSVMIVGLISYGAFYYFAPQPEPAELPTAGEEEAAGEPTDETADWKVYRNEEYGFEFKYPLDWTKEYEGGRGKVYDKVVFIAPNEALAYVKGKYGNEYVGISTVSMVHSTSTPSEFSRFWFGHGYDIERELMINNYPAYYVKQVVPSYTDHKYTISNNKGVLIKFWFREISRGFSPFGAEMTEEDIYSQYLPEFELIVKSIQFK